MKVFKFNFLAIALVLMANSVFAQSKTDAVKAFNAGLEEANAGNYDSAIAALTQALSIAEKLGPEGEDIKDRSEGQIPTIYFKKAAAIYKNFQQSKNIEDLDKAIDAFKEAADVAEEFNNEQIASRANGVIPQFYYQKSLIFYNNEEYDKSGEAVDRALNLNSNYAAAYYQKAKIFKKVNDIDGDGIIDQGIDEMLEWYDRAITVGRATNKQDVVDKAIEAAHDELLAVGTNASEDGKLDEALDILTKALAYDDESADVYYRLAEAHNKAGNPKEAVQNANKALDYEIGGRTDKAKIYYELGYAHQTLGNKSVACDAFTNALYGSFKSPAEHKMEFELKCDSTAPQN